MGKIGKQLYRKQFGAWGENEAAGYFTRMGLEVVARNYRKRGGEIDLIVKDGAEIVFVEVKTRRSDEFGYPEEAVTMDKLEHLVEAAEYYLEELPENQPWRIDVLAIIGQPGCKEIQFEWFKNVD